VQELSLCAQMPNPLLIIAIVFFAAALVQFIYLIVFIVALKRKRQPAGGPGKPVSIIVCAHDEEENLRQLVPILLAQQYADFEVIVVNDRSNDNTYDFLLEETKKDSRLKMVNVKAVPEHVNNKKYAITLGIRAAANDWILLTDADCRPNTDRWVHSMSEGMGDDRQILLGFSPYFEKPGFLNLFVRFESLITGIQYLAFALVRNPYMGVGRNLAYRKSLFLEKKGFNNIQHIIGGDDDLFVNQHANAKNTAVKLDPDSVVFSIPETTWSSFFYQKVRHLSVGKRYRSGDKLLLGLFQFTWIITLFVGLPLLVLYTYYYVVIAVLLVRLLLMIWSVQAIVKRAGLGYKYWAIPALDFLYPIYYISTGLVALLTKKVRWKKK
jgi:cellulose synthase/poly-beta-1,6-N-acetylglucosamine synthase-like glycosyltransferase